MELETILKNDNLTSLIELDIYFAESWTEKAVEYKAYKCLSYMLSNGTPLSQYCFLRASENNDIFFFTTYGLYLKSMNVLREVLERAYDCDYYELFAFVVKSANSQCCKKVLRMILQHIIDDPFKDVKDDGNDYMSVLVNHTNKIVKSEQLIYRPDLLEGKYLSKRALSLCILNGIRIQTSLLRLRCPRTFHLTKEMNDSHYDTIKWYSVKSNILFRGKFYEYKDGFSYVKRNLRRIEHLLQCN